MTKMVQPGKRKLRRGKERVFTQPEEIEKQLSKLNVSDESDEEEEKEEGSDSSEEEDTSSEEETSDTEKEDDSNQDSSEDDDDEEDDDEEDDGKVQKKKKSPPKPKGVQGLIEIENPNRALKKTLDNYDGPVQLTRREREEIEKQRARERYNKMHAEGRTDEAKADMARLAEIRKQRELAASKREEERLAKEADTKVKRELLNKALSKKGNVAK